MDTMYNYIKGGVFTRDNIAISLNFAEYTRILKAGKLLKLAKELPLEQKLVVHRTAKSICGGGDYLACAKAYANA